jgi:hypothetical protein
MHGAGVFDIPDDGTRYDGIERHTAYRTVSMAALPDLGVHGAGIFHRVA